MRIYLLIFFQDKESIKQIKRFVIGSCPDSKKNKFRELLENPKLGLLLNERLINIPNTLAPELHETIYEEVEWMKEDKQPFNFDTYLYLTSYSHKVTHPGFVVIFLISLGCWRTRGRPDTENQEAKGRRDQQAVLEG